MSSVGTSGATCRCLAQQRAGSLRRVGDVSDHVDTGVQRDLQAGLVRGVREDRHPASSSQPHRGKGDGRPHGLDRRRLDVRSGEELHHLGALPPVSMEGERRPDPACGSRGVGLLQPVQLVPDVERQTVLRVEAGPGGPDAGPSQLTRLDPTLKYPRLERVGAQVDDAGEPATVEEVVESGLQVGGRGTSTARQSGSVRCT